MTETDHDRTTEADNPWQGLDLASMPRPRLVAVCKAAGLPAFRAEQLFRWLHVRHVRSLDAMTEALAEGQRIEIRGFGSFSLSERAPRVGRNPKSGEQVLVPGKQVPHFKAGKELRERVDLTNSSD